MVLYNLCGSLSNEASLSAVTLFVQSPTVTLKTLITPPLRAKHTNTTYIALMCSAFYHELLNTWVHHSLQHTESHAALCSHQLNHTALLLMVMEVTEKLCDWLIGFQSHQTDKSQAAVSGRLPGDLLSHESNCFFHHGLIFKLFLLYVVFLQSTLGEQFTGELQVSW